MKKKTLKTLFSTILIVMLMASFTIPAFATNGTGDVATAIESTWTTARSQVETVVNNVVFPVIDLVLAVLFFVKVGTCYFEYKKHGSFLPHLHSDCSSLHLDDHLRSSGDEFLRA